MYKFQLTENGGCDECLGCDAGFRLRWKAAPIRPCISPVTPLNPDRFFVKTLRIPASKVASSLRSTFFQQIVVANSPRNTFFQQTNEVAGDTVIASRPDRIYENHPALEEATAASKSHLLRQMGRVVIVDEELE
jgi:hypothetical protein